MRKTSLILLLALTLPLITLTASLTALAGGIETYAVIKQVIAIQAGDAIAPHLWDWYFDGQDDYIVYDIPDVTYGSPFYSPTYSSSTWRVSFKYTEYPYSEEFDRPWDYKPFGTQTHDMSFTVRDSGWLNFRHVYNRYRALALTQPCEWYDAIFSARYLNDTTIEYTASVNGDILNTTYTDTQLNKSVSIEGLYLGHNNIWHGVMYKGLISYAMLWLGKYIDPDNLGDIDDNIINIPPTYFLDPTFFNGTHYLDLSPYGNHGTPYGGVSRVEADSKWLWVVKGLYNDTYVHLRFFPVGSVVRFFDASDGSLVKEVVIGDFFDERVELPAGEYEVVATCPMGTYYRFFPLTAGSLITITNESITVLSGYTSESEVIIDASSIGASKLVIHNMTKSFVEENTTGLFEIEWVGTHKVALNILKAVGEVHIHLMSESYPSPQAVFAPTAVVAFYESMWGILTYAVLLLVPATIYIKRGSAGLAAAALAVISAAGLIKPELRGLATVGLALSLAYLVFRLVWGREE